MRRLSRGRCRAGTPLVGPSLAAGWILAAVLAGCGTSRSVDFGPDAVVRPAQDLPDRFLVEAADGGAPVEPGPGPECRSPMVDPRDGTRLRLVRSASGRGDYELPAGRYGVATAELLRLECATGRPLGFVPR